MILKRLLLSTYLAIFIEKSPQLFSLPLTKEQRKRGLNGVRERLNYMLQEQHPSFFCFRFSFLGKVLQANERERLFLFVRISNWKKCWMLRENAKWKFTASKNGSENISSGVGNCIKRISIFCVEFQKEIKFMLPCLHFLL